ncbi:ribbon-helix-helix protein, CopG family [Frateuria sp. GZRe12]|uniref:ribbon-helix-helix protein, CopG family n=1 Tax=Frateuria sp. GZRe12 TaxID=3351533 RepID=UPI003EDC15D7
MQKTRIAAKPRIGTDDITRASVSFPSGIYAELERIAAAKKVSVAWVVREAAERYVVGEADLSTASSRGRK